MSKILKRPMFRGGGKVNSVGTGITSGLADREPMQEGGYLDSPYYKYFVKPAQRTTQTILSPFTNVGADIGNLTSKFLGGSGELFKYYDPISGKMETTSQFYESSPFITGSKKEKEETQEKQDLEKELDTLLKSTKTPSTAGQTPPIVTDEGKTTVTGTMDQPTPEPKLFEDDDLYSMSEENIKERAKFFEEMLAKDKKQKVFDALIAAAPGILEEDYGKAIKEAGAETKDDVERQARLLAIQEDIETRKAKVKAMTPTSLMSNVAFLTSDKGGGLSTEEAINRLAPVGTSFQKDYTPSRQIFDYTKEFQDNLDNFVSSNASGYGVGTFLASEFSVPMQTYEFNEEGKRVPTELQPGEVVWDPVNLVLKARNAKGETQFFDFDKNDLKSINPAIRFARG